MGTMSWMSYSATRLAAERCRRGLGPAAIVAETFRMGGHATHDEREAREAFPAELFAEWGKRDPIGLFEAYLTGRGVADSVLAGIEAQATLEMDEAAEEALESRDKSTASRAGSLQGILRGEHARGTRGALGLSIWKRRGSVLGGQVSRGGTLERRWCFEHLTSQPNRTRKRWVRTEQTRSTWSKPTLTSLLDF